MLYLGPIELGREAPNRRRAGAKSPNGSSTEYSPNICQEFSIILTTANYSGNSITSRSNPLTPSFASSTFAQRVEQRPIDLTSMLASPPQPSNPILRPSFGIQQQTRPLVSQTGMNQFPAGMNTSWNVAGTGAIAPPPSGHFSAQPGGRPQHYVDLSAFDSLVGFGGAVPRGGAPLLQHKRPVNQSQKSPLDDLLG